MRPFRDETELAAALRELRPAPRPEFAAELDARAAAGFRRDSRWGAALARLRERVASTPPRRLIAPAGGLAVAVVVVATAVVATTESGDPTSPGGAATTRLDRAQVPQLPSVAEEASPVHKVAPSSSAASTGDSAGTGYSDEAATGEVAQIPAPPN